MSVVQFVDHIRKDLEEILPRHVWRDATCIALVHLVPVESVFLIFIVEETILFVDDFPQRLEIIFGRIAGDVLPYAGRENQQSGQHRI